MARYAPVIWALLSLSGCRPSPDIGVIRTTHTGGLVYVEPVTVNGDTLRFLLDSGGFEWISERSSRGLERDSLRPNVLTWPTFMANSGLPAPLPPFDILSVRPNRQDFRLDRDGVLGHHWLSPYSWKFDYPNERLSVISGRTPSFAGDLWIPMFPGGRMRNSIPLLPTITVTIDGSQHPMLLDTGAMTILTDSAMAVLGDNRAAHRATSFVVSEVFDGWVKSHPEWRVLAHADRISGEFIYDVFEPMIRVPDVEISGHRVGPVWFTRRRTDRFHDKLEAVSPWQLDGALGGSGLKYFVLTLDYPNGIALFERPRE